MNAEEVIANRVKATLNSVLEAEIVRLRKAAELTRDGSYAAQLLWSAYQVQKMIDKLITVKEDYHEKTSV